MQKHLMKILKKTLIVFAALLFMRIFIGECASAEKPEAILQVTPQALRVGDVIKISIPGAPNLESTQQIRRDGRINLGKVGEVTAAGKTALALEKELMELYASQLSSKGIRVTLVPFGK